MTTIGKARHDSVSLLAGKFATPAKPLETRRFYIHIFH